jgi:dolichyl-phosphate beta-glucosyltransferase
MSTPELGVVIPAFNEESRLDSSLKRIVAFFRDRGIEFEVIVIDDGSEDRTDTVAREAGRSLGLSNRIRVLRNSHNRGKGYSVRRGMLETVAEYALLTDADLSTPIEDFNKLEDEIYARGCDIALGSRDVPGAILEKRQPWYRENAGKAFNRVVRFITGLPFRDTQCGFKLFKMSTCRDIFREQRIEKFAFDVEVLFIARKWGLRLTEVPITWRHSEGSKVQISRDFLRTAADVLRIRWNDYQGLYRAPEMLVQRLERR